MAELLQRIEYADQVGLSIFGIGQHFRNEFLDSAQVVILAAAAIEVITVKLQDGADVDGFLAANQAIEENHIVQQPGFIAREVGVSEDGEWMIVLHWETAADSAASSAKFGRRLVLKRLCLSLMPRRWLSPSMIFSSEFSE